MIYRFSKRYGTEEINEALSEFGDIVSSINNKDTEETCKTYC